MECSAIESIFISLIIYTGLALVFGLALIPGIQDHHHNPAIQERNTEANARFVRWVYGVSAVIAAGVGIGSFFFGTCA